MVCGVALAAPFEVKIHDELIAPYQEVAFEAEVKLYQPSLSSPINGLVGQSRFEIAGGISRGSEISVNLFTSHFEGKTQINGGKIAHIYIPEHDETGLFHYGVKNEINLINGLNQSQQIFYEITPIIGLHWSAWRLTLNPSFDFYLNGERKTIFAPAGKLTYGLSDHQAVGIEYYSELGSLQHPTALSARPDAAYLVWDLNRRTANYSVGVGKGVSGFGDKWVFKFIGSIPIDIISQSIL
jgi:hypothetical protein